MSCGVNLDEKEVTALLQQCEAEISELQYQLEQQQNLKSSLEQKLAIIRGLMAPTTPDSPALSVTTMPSVPPVGCMPKEILSIIFSELISNDPLAIGPLFLVCHHWNNIICGSPLLWSSISTFLAPHPPTITRWVNYVTVAVRHSGNTPLDVDITLPSIYDLWSLLSLKLLDFSPQFLYTNEWIITHKDIELTELNQSRGQLENWFHNAHYNSTIQLPLVEQVNAMVLGGMMSISDVITSHVFRLRSLTLRFHSGNLTDRLFQCISGLFRAISTTEVSTAPLLEELAVIDPEAAPNPGNNILMDPIPGLIRFSWGVAWPVTIVLGPDYLGRLTHLRLLVYQDLPSSEHTCNITHLFLDWSLIDKNNDQYRQHLYFPRLEDLTLFGLSGPCSIKSPHLTTLRLVDAFTCQLMLDNSLSFPSLTKLHVWASIDELENLEAYIGQLPLLTEVAFLYFSKEYDSGLRNLVRDDKISVKAYLYSPGKDHWRFTSYEHGEVPLN